MSAEKLQYGKCNNDQKLLDEHLMVGFGPEDSEEIKTSIGKVAENAQREGMPDYG